MCARAREWEQACNGYSYSHFLMFYLGKPLNYSVLSCLKHKGILNHPVFPELCIERLN